MFLICLGEASCPFVAPVAVFSYFSANPSTLSLTENGGGFRHVLCGITQYSMLIAATCSRNNETLSEEVRSRGVSPSSVQASGFAPTDTK